MLSVTFATRGAMAANRPIVEVLHFIGANDGFIAGQFQRHFLVLGLEGGLIGGGCRDRAVRAGRRWPAHGASAPRAANSLRCCSARSMLRVEGYLAIVVQAVADRGGDGAHVAAHRQPDAAIRSSSMRHRDRPDSPSRRCDAPRDSDRHVPQTRRWLLGVDRARWLLGLRAFLWCGQQPAARAEVPMRTKADGIVVLTGARVPHQRRARTAGRRARQAAADQRRLSGHQAVRNRAT